jgi:hypothetical protein
MRKFSFFLSFLLILFFYGCGSQNSSSLNPMNFFKQNATVEEKTKKDITVTNEKSAKNKKLLKSEKKKEVSILEIVENGDLDNLKVALENGADINIKNSLGQTPLHIAAIKNDKDIAELLINNGAKIEVKDNNGETPLFCSIRFGSSDVFTLLASKGVDFDVVNNNGEVLSSLVMRTVSDKVAFERSDIEMELAKNHIVVDDNPDYSEFYRKNPLVINSYIENPMKKIEEIVTKRINDFVSLKDNPVNIPPIVKKPKLPEPISLKKSEFESTRSFRARVEKAQIKRKERILALQNEYRRQVEARNEKIAEAEKIAKIRKESIPAIKKLFLYDAMNAVLGGFKISNPKYNADKELMYVTLKAKKANYKKNIAFRIPEGKTAKDFYENINKIPVKVVFSLENDALKLTDVEAKRGVLTAKADFNAGEYIKPETMEVVVKNNVEFKEANQKQNPNLVDTANVNIVVYEKTKNNFKDDLPKLLANTKIAEPDKTKWLMVIGVEDYDNTDKVIYSARSAKMFEKVASKVLGVPKSHIYSAIGDRATAGTIKTNFKRLVANVKPGDTIYFYYSGHGIPVLPSKEPYILPKDTVPDYLADEKFFKLKNLYKMLSNSNASKVIAFVDSCFSGATDGESVYKGVAASRLKAKKITFDTSKMAVITAGTDEQFSNMYPDKGHRLFSYYLMESILKGRKDVKTLYNEVYVEVKDTSFELGGDNKKQEPVLQGNVNLKL